jgi:hypothetical protein
MKRPIYKIAMYSILFVQASTAFATQTKITPAIGLGVSMVAANPGPYDIKNTDTTKIVEMILGQISKVQESDLKFIEETRVSINTSYNELAQLIKSGEFNELKNKSSAGQAVRLDEYLSAINKIQVMHLALESQIQSLSAITKGALPSQNKVNVAGESQAVAGYRSIDMSLLVSFYSNAVDRLLAYGNSTTIIVQIPEIGVKVISAETLHPNLNAFLGPKLMDSMLKQANENRVLPEELDKLMADQANEARRLIQTFITNYGTSESYRFKDESDRAARAQALSKIQEVFWSRSYLRVLHGIRLGAVQPITYVKRKVNIDMFTVLTESLRQFRQERATSEVDLANAAENVRNVLEVVDARSAAILGKNANGSLLTKANALITFIGGQTQTAESLLMIMQLVAGDIAEEQMMTSGGGRAAVREFYAKRYQATPEMKAHYTTLKCGLDTGLKECPKSTYSDVTVNQGGLRGIFSQLNPGLRNYSTRLIIADNLIQQINKARSEMEGAPTDDASEGL